MNKGDAHRVISALKNADFYGKRVYAEVAVIDKDYTADSGKGKKRASRSEIVDSRRESDKPRRNSRSRVDEADFERAPKKDRKRDRKEGKESKKHHGNFDAFSKKKKR